jgi:hypothetical protein
MLLLLNQVCSSGSVVHWLYNYPRKEEWVFGVTWIVDDVRVVVYLYIVAAASPQVYRFVVTQQVDDDLLFVSPL